MRLGPDATFHWARLHGIDAGSVSVDNAGNVYSTERFDRYVDLESGPGTFSALSPEDDRMAFVKYFPPGALAGVVWSDLNLNGARDLGEPLLADVKLRVYSTVDGNADDDDDVQVLPIVYSDASGAFRLAGLTPGSYFVRPELPAARQYTQYRAGGDAACDSDVIGDLGRTAVFSVAGLAETSDVGIGLFAYAPVLGGKRHAE